MVVINATLSAFVFLPVLAASMMETENMLENSKAKLAGKNVDMIVANNLKVSGAGFGTDTNVVTLITQDGFKELELMSKADVAEAIVSEILSRTEVCNA